MRGEVGGVFICWGVRAGPRSWPFCCSIAERPRSIASVAESDHLPVGHEVFSKLVLPSALDALAQEIPIQRGARARTSRVSE